MTEHLTEKRPQGDKSAIILSSRVRVARNLKDMNFRPKMTQDQADECIDRVLDALRGDKDDFRYYPMRGIDPIEKRAMVEEHRISADLYKTDDRGAALISADGRVVIMINEEDHLRIQAFAPGLDLETVSGLAYRTEDILERSLDFAFDEQLGYLTACPTNTGTGMRASVMLHLPLLTSGKNMGQVTQLAAKLGLTMRGIYGEGSEALGCVYQLSNQVTLGKTEHELADAVSAVAAQIAGMEQEKRLQALREDPVAFEDWISRAIGTLKYARMMELKEFYPLWSALRVGAAMGRIPLDVRECDTLLTEAQDAHLCRAAGRELTEREIREARSAMIRRRIRERLSSDDGI